MNPSQHRAVRIRSPSATRGKSSLLVDYSKQRAFIRGDSSLLANKQCSKCVDLEAQHPHDEEACTSRRRNAQTHMPVTFQIRKDFPNRTNSYPSLASSSTLSKPKTKALRTASWDETKSSRQLLQRSSSSLRGRSPQPPLGSKHSLLHSSCRSLSPIPNRPSGQLRSPLRRQLSSPKVGSNRSLTNSDHSKSKRGLKRSVSFRPQSKTNSDDCWCTLKAPSSYQELNSSFVTGSRIRRHR